MSSESMSESCCIDTQCACEDWLTAFCDYETVTLKYCGEETVFNFARSKGVRMSSVDVNSGVHPSDRVFRISMEEHAVDVGIGGIVVDAAGTEWVIYSVESLTKFCVEVLRARSVAACFLLLDDIDVLELECKDCDDCAETVKYKTLKRVKGKISASSGALSSRNDSSDLVYNFSGALVRWPLASRPTANNRLRDKSGTYRITRVDDGGIYVPYRLGLEQESADCSVR